MSTPLIREGRVSWKSPSNIALVKYWGKYGRQYPQNPSISFTLSEAHTITSIDFNYNENAENFSLSFLFEGQENGAFKEKIQKYLVSISDELPIINKLDLQIESSNSFPHSSGIASSASSMSALAMCLVDIESKISGKAELDLRKASVLSRLASGSASRSVFEKIAVWGKSDHVEASSNDYAVPYYESIHSVFHDFHDDILIISASEKSVSSRAGHALMIDNPYAAARFEQANQHLGEIIHSMEQGDIESFGEIVEKEALTLHALMMASSPPYILLEPNTITVIRLIQKFRKESNIPVYFTLDAGPNIHLLYPHEYLHEINILKEGLVEYCVDGRIIKDHVGNGPEKME